MITYVDILDAIAAKLDETFHVPVHSDEVLEGFSMPCFFVKVIPVTSVEHCNVTRTTASIVLTYFTDHRDQIEYLAVEDAVRQMLDIGFYVAGSRYIHLDGLSSSRVGEDQDILQLIATAWYYNKTARLRDKMAADADNTRKADTVDIMIQNDMTEDRDRKQLETVRSTYHEGGN
ncbi:DUF6838 family protein [uncultured Megasphaera sp.]|uniref:phage tail terminator family protein n=1 Tax=uncultured Megasphaera sp. TaxID=165188 RepID=UPI002658D8D3|nr:hypothetical protein [uncultured Megasphaera sp.]